MYNMFGMLGAAGGVVYFFGLAFSIWMIIDCVRNRRETYWIWIMLISGGLGALVYFFVYYFDASVFFRGAIRRHNLKNHVRELEAKVYHIDNAYHRTKLGDAYREQKRYREAEKQYRAALEHDPKCFDAKARLGCVLMDQDKAAEALPFLEEAVTENADYEYGDLAWHAAKCAMMLGDMDAARYWYERLLEKYTYPKARIEYATLLNQMGEREQAVALLRKLVIEGRHVPPHQARAERRNMRRAQNMLKEHGVKV